MAGRGLTTLVALGALALPAAAGAADPPLIDWNPFLPSVSTEYTPNTTGACIGGDPACVDQTLQKMYARFDRLYPSCDHNAVFSLTYIRVTEAYAKALRGGGFFDDPQNMIEQIAAFSGMYFESTSAWEAGDRASVPPAWRLALDAGRDKQVSALGNMLMSMNAHVNRDEPFMLAATGLTMRDGRSRKGDYDKGNVLLNQVYDDVLAENSAKFDATTDDASVPGTVYDDAGFFQILQGWREQTWRHAELLVAAKTPEARRLVAEEIENYAIGQGNMIKQATAYPSPVFGPDAKARDALCKANYKPRPGASPAAAKQGRATLTGRKVRMKKRKGMVELRCPAGGGDCPGLVRLQRGRRVTGSSSFALPAGTRRVVKVPLARGARAGRVTIVLRTPAKTVKRRGRLVRSR